MATDKSTKTAKTVAEIFASAKKRTDAALARTASKGGASSSGHSPAISNSLRKPPEGDEQADFFVPLLYDVATKDSHSIMDVAVFRLSKKDKRANETIRYERADGYVEVGVTSGNGK